MSLININNTINTITITTIKKMKNEIKLILISGNGGSGCVSFRKEKFVSRGGPDGGDGGDGGDIVLIPDRNEYDLGKYYDNQIFKAHDGEPGGKKNKNGKKGENCEIKLPENCEIKLKNGKNFILKNITVLSKGGEKGKGNIKFKSSINQEPLLAEYGQNGIKSEIKVISKSFPKVAIVGESNSGKSWLLNKLTGSRTKEAEYIFTTQEPFAAQLKDNINEIKIVEIPDFINIDKAKKYIPLLKNMDTILVTIPKIINNDYLVNFLIIIKKLVNKECKIIVMAVNTDEDIKINDKNIKFFNSTNYHEVKNLLLSSSTTEEDNLLINETYTHNPRIINKEMYKYSKEQKIIYVLDEEIIRIAKGSNLNKPEVQFQFHNILNKKRFFQEIEKEGIEKGATIKMENIELEYK